MVIVVVIVVVSKTRSAGLVIGLAIGILCVVLLLLSENDRFETGFFTGPNAPHPHLRETVPHFLPTHKMRRRQPPRAGAPKLSPAESKWTLNSFRCALPRAADIRLVQNQICGVHADAPGCAGVFSAALCRRAAYALPSPNAR